MRGYISVDDSNQGQIPVKSAVEVYRDPGDSQQVLAETATQTVPLGIADVTVSRKKDGTAPIVITPQSEFIEIRNNGNENGVTVVEQGEKRSIGEGCVDAVTRDAQITLGYQTDLHLTTERESKIKQNIVHEGEGDVVMGDDRSTTIGDDNVINRSDIGGPDDGGEVGDDNIINRSTTGSAGQESEPESEPEPAVNSGQTPKQQSAQFCMECGTELYSEALYCPKCGEKVPRETGSPETTSESPSASTTQQFCSRHEQTYTGPTCPECARENQI